MPETNMPQSSTTDKLNNIQPPTVNFSDDQQFVRLDNANAAGHSIYDKLNKPRFNPESAKIVEEADIGTLDDNVDITDPNYNETETEHIEQELASGHYHTSNKS